MILIMIQRRLQSLGDRLLLTFFVTQLLLNGTAAILQDRLINNLWVYHLNCYSTHCIFGYYFLKVLSNKQIVYWGFFLFLVSLLLITLEIQPYNSFPSYLYSISSFITILYAFFFLNQIIDTLPAIRILSLKDFWIITGILAYFGSSFFIFISYNYLSSISLKNVFVLWQLHNIFLCLACLLFLKAINSKKWVLK